MSETFKKFFNQFGYQLYLIYLTTDNHNEKAYLQFFNDEYDDWFMHQVNDEIYKLPKIL